MIEVGQLPQLLDLVAPQAVSAALGVDQRHAGVVLRRR